MPEPDKSLETVISRAMDLVDPAAQWQRTIWNTGSVLSLNELIEASQGAQVDALSGKAVKWLAQAVRGQIADDPGIGTRQERKALAALLERDLTAGGVNFHELATWAEQSEAQYLDRWADACRAEDRPSRERTARFLAAHLLDSGFSPQRVRSWLSAQASAESITEVAGLLETASALVSTPLQTFSVMLVLERPPRAAIARPAEWRDTGATKSWLEDHGFHGRRQHGGLLLEVPARDAYGAAGAAADVVDRLLARTSVGTRDRISFGRHAFIAGQSDPTDLRRTRRAEVRALEREDKLLLLARSGPVDDALELLSHLKAAPAPVAAAGGWSAVETVLSGPGDDDKVVTAERLAYLVACSWPRAELTTLAWTYLRQEKDDELTGDLRACTTNHERCQILLSAIRSSDVEFDRASDRLALRRVTKLDAAPRDALKAIQRRAEESLRRLYRQRNLVVHGGQVVGPALTATLRTVAPLVGAGLDRITHAFLTRGTSPLELAARAHFEVERAGSSGRAPEITSLLE